MIVEVADGWAVLWSSVAWLLTSLLVGWWGTRLPAGRLSPGPVTRLRRWEDGGRVWARRLAVDRWKDAVPEAGALLGGTSKRRVPSRRPDDLRRFRGETVRAERVHWGLLASTVVHAVWCRPNILVGMAAFGLVANLPCILIQRYNRGRLERVLERQDRRTPSEPDRPTAPPHPAADERRPG